MAIKVIDVSEHQGNIDWNRVKPNINASILRVGYGSDIQSQDDKYWVRNVSECQRLGIPYGVYLYSYADNENKAKSEIQHTLRLLKGHHPTFPVYFDAEDQTVREYCARAYQMWEDEIRRAGYIPGLYSGYYFRKSYMPNTNPYTWWLAWYNGTNGTVKPNTGGWNYDAWQYSSSAHIDGINGGVDISYFYKDFAPAKQNSTHTNQSNIIEVYRLRNNGSNDHFYTSSWSERDLLTKSGWTYEGVAWNSPKSGTPVYRLYNRSTGDHMWTISSNEIDSMVRSGWTKEGVAFYSSKSTKTPVYRLYNPKSFDHLFTISSAQKDNAAKSGYNYEGVAFYA